MEGNACPCIHILFVIFFTCFSIHIFSADGLHKSVVYTIFRIYMERKFRIYFNFFLFLRGVLTSFKKNKFKIFLKRFTHLLIDKLSALGLCKTSLCTIHRIYTKKNRYSQREVSLQQCSFSLWD